jgi:hypothetical protein
MSSYFQRVPDFNYINRLPNSKIGDYIRVKNLFKKGKLREDIFQNVAFFEKYQIVGNDRPDNIAFKVYNKSTLDWVVLLSNNILNIQSEWPLPQTDFDRFVLDKYGDYNTLYSGIHHYETKEIKNGQGVTIVPAGLHVSSPYSFSYYDFISSMQIETGDIAIPVTNYQYEEKIDNDKRNIFLLKPAYLNLVFDDMDEIMTYKKGSTQYVSESLKTGHNIRLYS